MHSLSLLVLVVAWSGAQATGGGGGVVDYQYVLRATSDPAVLIIDVRSPAEVSDLGSIPSSINIPCKRLLYLQLFCGFSVAC